MGMYNEVWITCPECGGQAYTQISQIVLGFGGFHIDDPHCYGMKRLSDQQLRELRERLVDERFTCGEGYFGEDRGKHGCGNTFVPFPSPEV